MVLRLWVSIRMTSRASRICGEDTLGLSPDLMDQSSPMHGKIPVTPVMGAQIDLILLHAIQLPLKGVILEKLQRLILANKPQHWFCIYLCIFILLHNCSLLTAHDEWYARKHGFQVSYSDTLSKFSLTDPQNRLVGQKWTLLMSFIKEPIFFSLTIIIAQKDFGPLTSIGMRARVSQWLTSTRSRSNLFVRSQPISNSRVNIEICPSRNNIIDNFIEPHFRHIRQQGCFEDEQYFISQLYEKDWKPRPTL
jgi:hypothetical protein